MRTSATIIALAASAGSVSHAHAGRIVDSFDHGSSSIIQLWVGQPINQPGQTDTSYFRRRAGNVLGGYRAAELEHVSSVPGRFVRISEAYTVPGALVYDGQPDASAIMRLEYSTGDAAGMQISTSSERFVEIDIVQADLGGVRATVELFGGEDARGSSALVTLSQDMTSGAQTLRFDLGGGAGLWNSQLLRVSFDAGSVPDADFAVGEIRLVPAPGALILGGFGCVVMAPVRRRR